MAEGGSATPEACPFAGLDGHAKCHRRDRDRRETKPSDGCPARTAATVLESSRVVPCVMAASNPRLVKLRYVVARDKDEWTLSEGTVPEAHPHRQRTYEIQQQLEGWRARSARSMLVGANLAIRWDRHHPSVGVDPDVLVVEPAPPEGASVASLRLWEPGHVPPLLAIEIVSGNHPYKDYVTAPDKYAACGTFELWIFDPDLEGPRAQGGPFRLQIWGRDESDELKRIYGGPGPARSGALGAWVFAVDEGRRLRIADDQEGTSWWLTPMEEERRGREEERKAKEAALARITELEAKLARRKRRR